MIAFSIFCLLAGSLLGGRFKVAVLTPAIGLALIAVAGVGVARGGDIGSIVWAAILAVTCLQIGYLGGSAALHARHRGSIETPATAAQSSHRQFIA